MAQGRNPALALLLEAINTYNNYFRPCVMLVEKKKRPDGKGYRCRYDRPRTPAQRAMESGVLTPEQTRKIQKVLAETNVVHLVELIQKRRNHLLRLLRGGDVRAAAVPPSGLPPVYPRLKTPSSVSSI